MPVIEALVYSFLHDVNRVVTEGSILFIRKTLSYVQELELSIKSEGALAYREFPARRVSTSDRPRQARGGTHRGDHHHDNP